MVVYHNNNSPTDIVHAAVRNSNGTYSWKSGGFKLYENEDYSTLAEDYKLKDGNNEIFYRLKNE